MLSTLETVLLYVAITFSNPFFPDFGLQFLTALTVGLVLPCRFVRPLHKFTQHIPGVETIEKKLARDKRIKKLFRSKSQRLKDIVPRLIAGYLVTYLMALLSAIILYFMRVF